MSDKLKETSFIQSAIEAQRGGLMDLGKTLLALRKASTITTVSDLDDISIEDPQVGQTLKYNGSAWVNGVVATGDGAFQPVDSTLTALAALDPTQGVIYQTGEDTFTKLAIGTTSGTIAAGDHTHAQYALTTHNHDDQYAYKIHNHDERYSLEGHDHDDRYVLHSHNHDLYYISVVATPTAGNFPTITAGGELSNSAYGPTSFASSSRTITGQNSITGGGDLSANRTFALVGDTADPGNSMVYGTDINGNRGWKPDPAGGGEGGGLLEATSSQVRSGTSGVAISPSSLYAASVPVALTDGATVNVDMSAGIIFTLTLGGNRAIANPTNQKVGQSGEFWIFQDATGGRSLSWGSDYLFLGGPPTLNTVANSVCVVAYRVLASGVIRCVANTGVTPDYAALTHNHDTAYISIVSSPTNGNFPVLTAGGELSNSTYGPASFSASGHNHDADYISIISSPTPSNFPSITAGGELQDSGVSAASFATAGHNHNGTHALEGHDHDDRYSLLSHNHDLYYISVVASPTDGNFPILTAGGELANSTYNSSSFATATHNHDVLYATAAQGALAESALQPGDNISELVNNSGFVLGTRSISTTHSITGGGDLSANRTLSLVGDSATPGNNMVYGTDGAGAKGWKADPAGGGGGLSEATSSNVRSGTSGVAISPSVLYAAMAPVTLTDGATVNVDMNAGLVFRLTLGGNRSIANPTNAKVGQSGEFWIFQDATGGRTLSWGTDYEFVGGEPELPTDPNAVAVVAYRVLASGEIRCSANTGADPLEEAQDAIGSILADSSSINFTYTDATPSITAVAIFGTDAGTVCEGNDSRLSDARTPTAHNHDDLYISIIGTPTDGNFPVMTAGGELVTSTYSNASFATAGHNHDATYQPLDAELTAIAGLTSVADRVPYFTGSGTAALATLTSFARTLLDDGAATNARTTLGLGTIATQSQSNVTIQGGTITGITDLAIADGGTGASTAADAFNALKQAASETATGVVELATSAETTAGLVVQASDTRLSDARTPTAHDHSGNKLAQANTHESADTDAATTSLHHTIGTGANQAAAGNHNHDSAYAILSRSISTTHSLTGGGDLTANRTLALVNDTASPGNNMVYGTDGTGTRGWKADPAGEGASYTNEEAQDAVGSILTDSSSIDFTYDDGANTITAVAIFGTGAGTVCQGNDARLSDARTPTNHDHSANKLAQANTHESADTDTATTSLHHTIGTGANQAASGNHTHAALYQPLDGELTALAGLTSAADALPYFTGSGTADVTTLTAFGRSLIDDADNTAARTTLGLGSIATQASNNVTITGGSVTGITDLAIADGGTGASTAAAAFSALKQDASETATGVVELATNAEVATGTDTTRAVTPAGAASRYQIIDSELTALAGLTSAANALPYFTGAGTAATTTFTAFGRSLVDDADAAAGRTTLGVGTIGTLSTVDLTTNVTGALPIGNGGTGQTTAANAFNALKQAATTAATGVVQLATDGGTTAGQVVQANDTRLHAAVTLAGAPTYLTLSGQQITRALIDLASHVTGTLPIASVGNLATATETGTTRTNTSADRSNFVRWTNTGAKTFTVANSVAAAGDVWQGFNAAASGNLTLAQGAGVTLTGDLIFAPKKAYTIRFTAASTADVIGGSAT